MEKVKEFLKSNKARTFYWQTFNGALLLLIAFLGDLDQSKYPYLLLVISILNLITKEINKKVNIDYWK